MLNTYATVILEQPDKVNGTLILELVSVQHTFDLLPLLHARAACAELIIILSGAMKINPDPINWPEIDGELTETVKDNIEALLDVHNNPEWRDYALGSASALNFTIKDKYCWDPAEWNMVVNLHAMEDWIDNYYTASFPQDTKWEMGKWVGRI
jgi:hypothetical protein